MNVAKLIAERILRESAARSCTYGTYAWLGTWLIEKIVKEELAKAGAVAAPDKADTAPARAETTAASCPDGLIVRQNGLPPGCASFVVCNRELHHALLSAC